MTFTRGHQPAAARLSEQVAKVLADFAGAIRTAAADGHGAVLEAAISEFSLTGAPRGQEVLGEAGRAAGDSGSPAGGPGGPWKTTSTRKLNRGTSPSHVLVPPRTA